VIKLELAIIARILVILIWTILSICILLHLKPKPLRIAYWKIKSKMFPEKAESWIREMMKARKAVCDFLQISEEELDTFVKILNKARYVTVTFEKGRFRIEFKDKYFPRGLVLVLSKETPTGKISKEYDLSLPIKKERRSP
jgi:hypothetical protein